MSRALWMRRPRNSRDSAAGQGLERLREVLGLLAEKNYTGYLSYEARNPDQWARSPCDIARDGAELTRNLLRNAVPTYAM